MASECACGGACHKPVPNDAAGLASYLRERLEGTGIGSTPARSMNHTIARIREPFIHGGSAW